jgi:RNA polymerase sigma-70 factor (ECF subfamily)
MEKSQKTIPEWKLIQRIKDSNITAFEILFHRYFSIVLRFINGFIKNNAESEDIAMDVFTRVWLFRERLDPSKSFRNYLFVLSKNAVFNHLASKQAKLEKLSQEVSDSDSWEKSVEQTVFFSETRNKMQRLVSCMPPQRQEVFKMSRIDNLSNQEIADKLGISVRTVEKHIQLALREIRNNLN